MDTEEALEKIRAVHGDKYGLPEGWEYVNAKEDIILTCKEHGEFHKDFYRLVNLKQGCPYCSYGQVVKPFGYWNSYDNCLEEAKKYRNKFQLQKKSFGCYQSMKRNGWLDDISKQVFDDSILYMDYEEKINLIYVYEFQEFNVFYVGRTNNIKRRDKQHRNGYNHTNGSKTFDNVYKFANANWIDVPVPKILEEGLNALESQEREDYWKNKYIENGWTALNKAKTGVGKSSLGATMKWTYDACKEEAKKYSCKHEMKQKCVGAYNACVKNKWINDFFVDKKKADNYWNNLDNVLEAAKQCRGAKDMLKRIGGAYNAAIKNGWVKLLKYGESK